MQDHPPRKKPRKIEVIATEIDPQEVLAQLERANLGWHFLCHIHTNDDDFDSIRSIYKSNGYRAVSREALFIHDLKEIPVFESDPPVIQLRDQEHLDSIPQQAQHKRHLLPDTRKFCAHDDVQDFGWVTSIPVGEDAWVAGLYVNEIDRKRGYGRALMSKMLQVDKAEGVRQSVLLATSDGARLYPHLGYKKVATLQMFCPVSRPK